MSRLFDPITTEVSMLETWLITGHLPEDTVFGAESTRQALDNIHKKHGDEEDLFEQGEEGVGRFMALADLP